MRLNFRHGIVQYTVDNRKIPTFLVTNRNENTVDLSARNNRVLFTIAHNDTDYLYEEREDLHRIWGPYLSDTTYWMYLDIDVRTGYRTCGDTLFEPVVSATEPTRRLDQHWFDLNRTCMYVFDGTHWIPKVRIFIGNYLNHNINVLPLGSQVELYTSIDVGTIIYSDADTPASNATLDKSFKFLTTESPFYKAKSISSVVSLQSIMYTSKTAESIPAFSLVYNDATGAIRLASYDDPLYRAASGMVIGSTNTGSDTFIRTYDIVENPSWNFTKITKPAYLGLAGEVSEIPPKYGFIQRIGTILSETMIQLDLSSPVIRYDGLRGDLNTIPVGFDFSSGGASVAPVEGADGICSTFFGVFGNIYKQPIPNDVWILKHHGLLKHYLVQVMDDTNKVIYPETIRTINDTTIEVSFTNRMSGSARLFLF